MRSRVAASVPWRCPSALFLAGQDAGRHHIGAGARGCATAAGLLPVGLLAQQRLTEAVELGNDLLRRRGNGLAVCSPSSSSCRDTSGRIWAATSSLARARSSCLASRTAARRSFVAAWASRIISRYSFIAASSRSSSLMAASSPAGRAKAAPTRAGNAVARTAVTPFCVASIPAGTSRGAAQRISRASGTGPFRALHAREPAERYLARLSTSTMPAGCARIRQRRYVTAGAAPPGSGQNA